MKQTDIRAKKPLGDGWMSKKSLNGKFCQQNRKTARSPKVSSIRYGALKHLELPPEKKLKQMKLFNFKPTKTNKKKPSYKSKTVEDTTSKSQKAGTPESETIPPKLESCETSKLWKTKVASCMELKNTNINDIKHEELLGSDETASASVRPNPDSLGEYAQDDYNESYDLTMKYVEDSQGNQVFDHLTQRTHSTPDESQPIDSEMFLDFKNGIHVQSTLKFVDE